MVAGGNYRGLARLRLTSGPMGSGAHDFALDNGATTRSVAGALRERMHEYANADSGELFADPCPSRGACRTCHGGGFPAVGSHGIVAARFVDWRGWADE